jgi:hypothetical protein
MHPPVLRQPGCPPRLLWRTRDFASPGCPGFALIGTDSSVYMIRERIRQEKTVFYFNFNIQMRRGSSEPSGFSSNIAKLQDIPSSKKLFKTRIQKSGFEDHPGSLIVACCRRPVYVFN